MASSCYAGLFSICGQFVCKGKLSVRGATFAGDFAHAIGAVRLKSGEKGLAKEDDYPWRSGLFTVVRKVLVNSDLIHLLEKVVHGSRVLTAPLFDMLWRQVLATLFVLGEGAAAKKLTSYYLCEGEEGGLYEAQWRGAPDRLQPGSYVGSQPQDTLFCNRMILCQKEG